MSARQAPQASSTGSRVGISALILVLVAAVMLLLVRAEPETEPFDPRSSAALGARGLVLLLEEQGAAVDVVRNAPNVGTGVDPSSRVLVLQDRLDAAQRRDLLQFVDGGGLAVMADPDSTILESLLVGETIESGNPTFPDNDIAPQVNVELGECDIPTLARLRGLFVTTAVRYVVPEDARSCFVSEAGAFAVVREHGAGLIVQLGDNELFTNHLLRYADNGPLATALLAPSADAHVSILLGKGAAKSAADIGTGDKTLSDLLRPSVWMGLTQLAIAFVIFAIARAVRPGRPVREPDQVPIAGSALVVATGTLMRRAGHAERAAWMLRGNLYRLLCRRFHLPSTTPIELLDEAVATNTSLAPGRLAHALQHEVVDDAGLLQLSNELQNIREAILEETLEGASS
ncbi:MAG: DUF4350 domain-containing protein [Actinobacteria bacterium]|nr:DUF4350 domain-containing protein [Actinomycetota bacterium]